jgi:integrase
MGHVIRTDAGTYRANWRDAAGRQRSKTFPSEKAATGFLAQVRTATDQGTYVDPAAGRVRFAEHAERWLAARNDEATTAARDASIMHNHVIPRWGTLPVNAIEHMAVQEWVTELGGTHSRATVAEAFRLCSAVMRSAVRNRMLAHNPCEDVRLPRRRKVAGTDRLITRDEFLNQLLPVVTPDRYRVLVGLAGGAGLRWGEAAGLRWDAVDLEAGTLRVERVMVEVAGHITDKPYPKSKAGRRTVPLPAFLVELLQTHRDTYDPGPEGEITTNADGRPALWRSSFSKRVLKPALQRAGLDTAVRFHDLRHCYATWLIDDGCPINVVKTVMGHEQASTTLDRYTHTPDGSTDRVRDAFPTTAQRRTTA